MRTMSKVVRYTDDERAQAKSALVMPRHELDDIDLKVLTALQSNGRMTNVELSRRIGISAPPSLRRVRTLERKGYIRGYHADIDPKMLGFNVVAFVNVGLISQAEQELRAFKKHLNGWHIVREAYSLQGEFDYLLRCVGRDLIELQSFVADILLTTSNVKTVKTSLLFEVVKKDVGLPICP
jgi:DNA-binding Lrp family transcriptional regulator